VLAAHEALGDAMLFLCLQVFCKVDQCLQLIFIEVIFLQKILAIKIDEF
jgi:hypothetical protein